MRITKEHVGKKVRLSHWSGGEFLEVLCVGGNRFFSRSENGAEDNWLIDCDWHLVEEPKKPSERITEILIEYQRKGGLGANDSCWCRFRAIEQYLDEQYETNKGNDKRS